MTFVQACLKIEPVLALSNSAEISMCCKEIRITVKDVKLAMDSIHRKLVSVFKK
jgi:hypothetical protein